MSANDDILLMFVNDDILVMFANDDIYQGRCAMTIRTPRDLGLIIRDRRHTKGLGQQELARRIGVRRQWVINMEKGKPTAEVGLILKALLTLGLAVDVSEDWARSKPTKGQPDIDAVIRAALRKGA